MNRPLLALTVVLACGAFTCVGGSRNAEVRSAKSPPDEAGKPHYTGSRSPLRPTPFIKLDIGAIRSKGWLRDQLVTEAEGMTGRLPEVSKWCQFEGNAWATPDGQGHSGWEELPYWLKGYGDLGYVLGDEEIQSAAKKWIDAVLASQDADGWFGPRSLKTSLEGKPDLWPHMVMCNVLQSYYEFSHDRRVLPFLSKYFQWLHAQPASTFGNGYWPKMRAGDNVESVHWLYNRTGEPWLLDLAREIHENMARWDKGVVNWHNVNIAQGFRAPAMYYVQDGRRELLDAAERNYQAVMGVYGQFPGGGFAGDENCRPGYVDPRQGFETCGIVEFMHSFEMLARISGNPVWADRTEELAFNSLPAALTPDQKALHYLTCANQVQLDRKNKAPGIQNEGTMFSYSPYQVYRCCQHNVSHGWPYFAEEMWAATVDRGLCSMLYAPSSVTAKVGDGAEVTIEEKTEYPFEETISFAFATKRPVSFPFYLRIPRWCNQPAIKLNGRKIKWKGDKAGYAVIERTWKQGDAVTLQLPMQVGVRKWERNHNSVSVDYGPLTFSLKIGERWSRYGSNTNSWPEYEVFPTTPWNYALIVDEAKPQKSFDVVRRTQVRGQPFTPDGARLEIRAKGRRVSAWQADAQGLVGKLQQSPVASTEPVESLTLIPMGAARLRISSFPVAAKGKGGFEWRATAEPPVSASHCFESDTVEAMVDGIEAAKSNDRTIPRFTWWDHRGTEEWVAYEFDKPRRVSGLQVFWFDDSGIGSCRVPESWRILYRAGSGWQPVKLRSIDPPAVDRYNRAEFEPVETTALRIETTLKPNMSAGILEWKVAP